MKYFFSTLDEKVEWQVALLNAVADYTKKKMTRNITDIKEVNCKAHWRRDLRRDAIFKRRDVISCVSVDEITHTGDLKGSTFWNPASNPIYCVFWTRFLRYQNSPPVCVVL